MAGGKTIKVKRPQCLLNRPDGIIQLLMVKDVDDVLDLLAYFQKKII